MHQPETSARIRRGAWVLTMAMLAAVPLGAPATIAAQEPTLVLVLGRAAAYVTEFQRRFSGIVAEETYVQRTNAVAGVRVRRERELKSDVLLVRPGTINQYVQFRDVFEVDGAPVRNREERLTRLFLDPSPSADEQINRIIRESARYNIGDIERTINLPTLPLLFLDPANQQRFRFARSRNRVPTTIRDLRAQTDPAVTRFSVSTDVWVVQYREVERPTMIRTNGGRDLSAHGRIWIEPDSGQILLTELVAEDGNIRGVVEVRYQFEPSVGVAVPVAMRDRWEELRGATRIDGYATYGRFRRFDVRTTEQIQEPVPQAPRPK